MHAAWAVIAGSGCALALPAFAFGILFQEDGAEAMQVASDNGQRDRALEAVDAVIATEVQTVSLQGIDRTASPSSGLFLPGRDRYRS